MSHFPGVLFFWKDPKSPIDIILLQSDQSESFVYLVYFIFVPNNLLFLYCGISEMYRNTLRLLWGENKAKYNIDERIRENLCRLFISKENVCLSNLYHDESSSRSIVLLERSEKTN
ncbi:hypothetical protein PHYBLDRAFT_162725 [Phycomyces blakesleeanus NRRL 1555(-)]|uniref:Uncharacterized protein n=1 Tax=Phycomyces blakesleeanus (strain ATCC 8743b / DSM 1359 / FGSC 10004 / NBRC 33097 / NRRL 1555) TaxID=763407 RepID=A0A167QGM6_PHYB8|nr:hypothetical protein PHYBLDRAFT_162725 [Phycomyces blakesleeanus NRRL 1555(-)]OAD79667.1 hypothetical protein PHYBLDRAFT_162725 [Phycomyces blakesleeanus NRRL 1555(-)]|eukprot:XP_018297707.1 hypothetical protein PHYBLDRAFT_162725 [Phycomyces blakesleeanus NRRL 1555(-)]